MKRTACLFVSLQDFRAFIETTYWVRGCMVLFTVVLGVGYAVGFAVASTSAASESERIQQLYESVFSQWQMEMTQQFTRVESLAVTFASYSLATATTPYSPNMTMAERLVIRSPDVFDKLCVETAHDLPGIYSTALIPYGVIAHACPKGSIAVGFDTMAAAVYAGSYKELFRVKGLFFIGPLSMVAIPGATSISAWYPVFVNDTHVPRSQATYWGSAMVSINLKQLIADRKMHDIFTEHNIDFVMWWTETFANGTTTAKVIGTSTQDDATTRDVMANGKRMVLPSQPSKGHYLALYPRGGVPSSSMSTAAAVGIAVGVFFAAALMVCVIFITLYVMFCLRHRKAPLSLGDAKDVVYSVAVSLSGAQPIAERSPLDAVQMFAEFLTAARAEAWESGCYPICDVGDRTLYAVAKTPEAALCFAKAVVQNIQHIGVTGAREDDDAVSDSHTGRGGDGRASAVTLHSTTARSHSHSNRHSRTHDTSRTRETSSQPSSSFIATTACRPRAAIHCGQLLTAYDADRDKYFFTKGPHLQQLCGALDRTRGGEVGWTAGVEAASSGVFAALRHMALSSHVVTEGGADACLHVASLWAETGNERDNEDPSVAMAALGDVYVTRISATINKGRGGGGSRAARGADGGGGNSSGKDPSNISADATAITRTCTLLHIRILDASPSSASPTLLPLDIVRRAVAQDKGAVVSAYGNAFVAAYNLLAAGGHHQARAADTVARLRASLPPSTEFVCSLHCGKVNALIADGIVMCSGDAVETGRALLDRAEALRASVAGGELSPSRPTQSALLDDIIGVTSSSSPLTPDADKAEAVHEHCLCLLFGANELSSTFECEAVDIVVSGAAADAETKKSLAHGSTVDVGASTHTAGEGRVSKIVYRLAHRKAGKGNKANTADDEWMYQLRDEEDLSPFAVVNVVFRHMAAGEMDEARRIWSGVDSVTMADLSDVAKRSVAQHLKLSRQ